MSSQVVFEFENYLLYKYEGKGGTDSQNFISNGYHRTDISPTNPVTIFVRCKVGGKLVFMDALAFGDGLDEQKRIDYWNNRTSGKKPFVLYEPNGSTSQVDTYPIWKDPSKYSTLKDWDAKQSEAWLKLVRQVCENPLPRPPISRDDFLDPFKDKYLSDGDLYITPRNAPPETLIFDRDDLKAALVDIVPNANFWTVDDAKEHKLVLIGVNFFNLFWTWVTEDKYRDMWSKFGITTLQRDWPQESQAADVNKKMQGENLATRQARDKNHAIEVQIFQKKIVQRQRNSTSREYEGESTMGISSSKIFNTFWKGSSGRADWLHRVALMFAIASPTSGPVSDKDKLNFVFGTYESNRDMLRAELTAKEYLARYAACIQDSETPAFINTVNYRTGTVDRINVDGSHTKTSIPDWVANQRYAWLSFRLDYSFYHKIVQDTRFSANLSMNAFTDFDPFSRYRPLMKEVDMDYAVMEAMFKKYPPASDTTVAKQRAVSVESRSPKQFTGTRISIHDSEIEAIYSSSHNSCGFGHSTWPSFLSVSAKHQSDSGTQSDGEGNNDNSGDNSGAETTDDQTSSTSTSTGTEYKATESEVTIFFGNSSLKADLTTYEPKDSSVSGSAEKATLKDVSSIVLSSVFPALSDTLFNSISFQNVTFFHQTVYFDPSKPLGWHLTADLVLNDSCGSLRTVLSKVLSVDQAKLTISAAFGTKGSWTKALDAHSFTVQGEFSGLSFTPPGINWLRLTSIGARLFGVRGFQWDPSKPTSVLRYGFGIFGGLDFSVPGSVVPLTLQYNVTEFNGIVSVIADLSGEIWKDAFGIRGLSLDLFDIYTTFSLTSPWKSMVFSARAGLVFKNTNITFAGTFASKNDFKIAAKLEHFNLQTLADLYERVTGNCLSLPEVDITFGTASLSLSSDGFAISFSNVVINGYTSVNATLVISRSGARLRGDLTSRVVNFAGISVKDAFVEVSFQSGRRSEVALGGVINFSGIDFTAAVYFYKESSSVEWTVFASLTDQDGSIKLEKFLPGVDGTCLENVALTKVAFVAASRDQPYIGDGNIVPDSYVLRKGVQVCAMFGTVDAINGMVRHNVDGIVLSAGWESGSKFTFGLTIPTNLEIGFDTGITTTPIAIQILTSPSIQLRVSAGIKVPVPKQDPLYFYFWLSAGIKGASFTPEMSGYWSNPFGIGQQVKIGNVYVNVGIIYAQFASTGTPSEFGVGGQLQIGNTKAGLKLNFSEDPQNELLYAYASNLSMADLVAFARQVTGKDIPRIQDVINITINYLSIYICINGVWIGSKWYPPGFAFSADMKLWDNTVNIMCSVKSTGVTIHGGTPSFHIGILWIHGRDGRSQATFDCTIGPSIASFEVDGAVTVWWWFFGWHSAEIGAHVKVQLYPSFRVSGNISVGFTLASSRAVALSVTGVGRINEDSSDGLTFAVTGSFEEDLLDHLHNEIRRHFELGHQVRLHGFDAVHSSIEGEESNAQKSISLAEVELQNARRRWDDKREQVEQDSEVVIQEYERQLTALETRVENTRNSYHGALELARIAVQSSTNTRAAKLVDARFKLAITRRQSATAIEESRRALDVVIDDMYRIYGNSGRDLRHAERALRSVQTRSQSLMKERNRLRDSPMADVWETLLLPQLEDRVMTSRTEEGRLEVIIADAGEARASDDYQRKKSAILESQSELKVTEEREASAVAAAEENLSMVDALTAQACEEATRFYDSTLTGVDYQAFQAAIRSVSQFKLENGDSYNAAKEALETLLDSAEHRTYLLATTNLLAEREQLQQVLASKDLLDGFFRGMSEDTLDSASRVMHNPHATYQIRGVVLSGELQPFLGAEGTRPRPLTAAVDIQLRSNEYTHPFSWHPSLADEFVVDVFKFVWGRM